MALTLTWETEENTPLVLVLADVARYGGAAGIGVDDEPAVAYAVLAVDESVVTVQPWSDADAAGTGPRHTIALNDITSVHVY